MFQPILIVHSTGFWPNGDRRSTVETELAILPQLTSKPLSMLIKSPYEVFFQNYPPLFGIESSQRGQWRPLKAVPRYEYSFESTDGHVLDTVNIRGPFDEKVLLQIMEKLETAGLEFIRQHSFVVEIQIEA